MLRKGLLGGLIAAGSLIAAPLAVAQSPPAPFAPYDGAIPFICVLQDVGTGTDFPDPGADPFCVEFDKTNQNVAGFGIAEFVAQEPARVAAASPKCFYYQRDHWTGSVVQGSEPELWHWDGAYFFDKARGVGGVSVANFRVGGVPMDAGPYVPEAYRPYFGSGGGGAMVTLESSPDPRCAEMVDTPAEQAQVYGVGGLVACAPPGGELQGRRIGKARLGMRRAKLVAKLGAPAKAGARADRWCLAGKGELRVAYSRQGRARALLSSGRGHSLRGVARGDRSRRARRRLELGRRVTLRRSAVVARRVAGNPRRRAWIGTSQGRVRWVAITVRRLRLASLAGLSRDAR